MTDIPLNEMSPGMQRFAAVAVLALLLVGIYLYCLAPLWQYYVEKWGEVSRLQRQVGQYEYLVSNRAVIEEEFARVQAMDSSGDLFLSGDKPAIASANLRDFIGQAVQRSGGQLVSSQEYMAPLLEATTPLGLRLQVNGDVDELLALLHALEDARPLIFIDELTVTSAARARLSARTRSRRTEQVAPILRKHLDVRLDVVGYLAGGGS